MGIIKYAIIGSIIGESIREVNHPPKEETIEPSTFNYGLIGVLPLLIFLVWRIFVDYRKG